MPNGCGATGAVEEELAEQMLVTVGTEIRPDTSPLLLEPADLALFESLAPLLGDTPRRVKRFVNICQLLYATHPADLSRPISAVSGRAIRVSAT